MRGNASGFFSPDASSVNDLRSELQLKELNKQADAAQQQAELDMLARGNQQSISTPEYARNHIMVDRIAQDYAREVKFYNDPKLETPVLGDVRKIAHHFERGEVAQGMGDALLAGVTYAPFAKALGGLKTAVTQAIERNVAKRVVSNSSAPLYRYMTQGEISAINKTNMLRGGSAGETYFTKDVYKTAVDAQKKLALPNTPTFRVEFELKNAPSLLRKGTKVAPNYGMPGGGSEFMTMDPVQVRIINAQPIWRGIR